MGKKERIEALKDRLDKVLPNVAENMDAKVMLWTYVKGFKILSYRKESTGLAKAWYTFIAMPMFIDGYIRDVRVNSTSGKKLFPDYYKFGTFTATIQRVIDAGIGAPSYVFAVQIADVLNDYDPGHIKFN